MTNRYKTTLRGSRNSPCSENYTGKRETRRDAPQLDRVDINESRARLLSLAVVSRERSELVGRVQNRCGEIHKVPQSPGLQRRPELRVPFVRVRMYQTLAGPGWSIAASETERVRKPFLT